MAIFHRLWMEFLPERSLGSRNFAFLLRPTRQAGLLLSLSPSSSSLAVSLSPRTVGRRSWAVRRPQNLSVFQDRFITPSCHDLNQSLSQFVVGRLVLRAKILLLPFCDWSFSGRKMALVRAVLCGRGRTETRLDSQFPFKLDLRKPSMG